MSGLMPFSDLPVLLECGVFALVGPFKFHSISLCGRLDSLPSRTTFGFRNALHLLEARDSVADVRGIFQRLLALLADIRSRAGLVSLAIIFLPREHSLLHGGPELFYHVGLWQLFQLLARGLVDVFFSRGFSHAGLIHFLLDASERCLAGFLLGIVFMHTCTISRVQRDYRSIWNTAGGFRIVFIYRAVLNSLDEFAKRSISSVKQRVAFHTVGGLDYRRRTVSEDRRRV